MSESRGIVAIEAQKVDYLCTSNISLLNNSIVYIKPQCAFTAQLQSKVTLREKKKQYQKKVFIFCIYLCQLVKSLPGF